MPKQSIMSNKTEFKSNSLKGNVQFKKSVIAEYGSPSNLGKGVEITKGLPLKLKSSCFSPSTLLELTELSVKLSPVLPDGGHPQIPRSKIFEALLFRLRSTILAVQ